MGVIDNKIQFTVVVNTEEQVIHTYVNEYRNLMVLLKDQLCIDGFGECGGMGRCGTCTIRSNNLFKGLGKKERNEDATLSKMCLDDAPIRLSCQMFVNKELDDLEIEILE